MTGVGSQSLTTIERTVRNADRKLTISSVQDLDVYRRLVVLHLEIHRETLSFPRFEMYELGSQIRRSSNSIPANLAEGWNNKHSMMYLEGINRGESELRETKHHLWIAHQKGYLEKERYTELFDRYDGCARMLHRLKEAIARSVNRGR